MFETRQVVDMFLTARRNKSYSWSIYYNKHRFVAPGASISL
jgi:hypothetical protein